MKRYHAAAVTALFCLGLLAGFVGLALHPSPAVLQSERRKPGAAPGLSDLVQGLWADKMERFLADKFPLREGFRRLRAEITLRLLRQSDKDGLYFADGHAGKFEPLDEAAARRFAEKIAALAAEFPRQQLYYAVIPDKSLYASRAYPGYDPERLRALTGPVLAGLTEIDLASALDLDCYYPTDLHWDQARLQPVAEALGEAMQFAVKWDYVSHFAGEFQGVYAGQLALPMDNDTLTCLRSKHLDRPALYLDPQGGGFRPGEVYRLEKAAGRDPYDLFLDGAQPLVVLENPEAQSTRELFLFRDSFGSSLAPLLLESYCRVTLIDLRYINARVLGEYVTFPPGADVLFLYGAQNLNHPETLMT